MKVSWFIPVQHRDYNRMSASLWIRCLQLLPYLEEEGIECTVNDPDAQADIAIFVRSQDEAAYQLAQQQKARGCKIVFDLCVNFFDATGLFKGGYGTAPERVDETKRMVSVADAVTCASQNIADRARDFHPRVEYVPDSIDLRHFEYRKTLEDFERPKLRVIWSGYSRKAVELAPILPLLRRYDFELVLISEASPQLRYGRWLWKRRFPYQFRQWHYDTFPQQILQGEICVSYRMVDNTYNRGHSIFKVGVFMSQGVPVIASPVPSYLEVVNATGSGQICYTTADWKTAFERIVENRQILKQWSLEACQHIDAYATATIARQYCKLFTKICA